MHDQLHVQMIRAAHSVGRLGISVTEIHNGPSGVHNGMSAQLANTDWRRSKHSGSVGNCVELAPLTGGEVAVRNSRYPDGPTLIYTRDEMAAFLFGAKDGEFDDMIA